MTVGTQRSRVVLIVRTAVGLRLNVVNLDANLVLLKFLAEQNGVFEWVRSSETLDYKLKTFLAKVGVRPVENLKLAAPAGTDMVYALDDAVFPGSAPAWVGQYSRPGRATFAVSGGAFKHGWQR